MMMAANMMSRPFVVEPRVTGNVSMVRCRRLQPSGASASLMMSAAAATTGWELDLSMRADPVSTKEGGKRHTQWFNFGCWFSPVHGDGDGVGGDGDAGAIGDPSMSCQVPDELSIRLVNAASATCADDWEGYQAMCRAILRGDEQDDEDGDGEWARVDTRVGDGGALCIRIAASDCQSVLRPDAVGVRVSYFAPFTLRRHERFVAACAAQPGVTRSVLATSVQGRPVDVLHLRGCETRRPDPDGALGAGSIGAPASGIRPQIWVICRQHPSETMAEWWCEGFLRRLCPGLAATDRSDSLVGGDADASALRQCADIHVVPCANPDGARGDLSRVNAAGSNLNREWASSADALAKDAPEVAGALAAMVGTGCDLLLDVHGDESLSRPVLCCAPAWTKRLDVLQRRFLRLVCDASGDVDHDGSLGFLLFDPPRASDAAALDANCGDRMDNMQSDGANLTLCSTQAGARFDCLAVTLEQCFRQPWSVAKSRELGAAFVSAMVRILPALRDPSVVPDAAQASQPTVAA